MTGELWAMRTLAGVLVAAVAVLAAGCASRSPFDQSFVEVRTPNFHLTSSFGDAATRVLARDLEVFHSGVLAALGVDPTTRRSRRTRVLALDDRSFSRPFAERGAPASLLPAVDGPILMIRVPGGFRGSVGPELRHRYAHRILREASKATPPLWYEEGRAQVASTIVQSDEVVVVGRMRPEYRQRMLDWRRKDLTQVMQRRNLATASDPERVRFEASTWAIVHTILFDSPGGRQGRDALDRVRFAFESNRAGALRAATRALGSETELTNRVYAHLEKERSRVDRMEVEGLELADLEVRALSPATARDRLGELALELERPELAAEYFERALADRSDHARALAGQALADVLAGDLEDFEARVSRVIPAADSDAVVASRLGRALAVSARSLPEGALRRERLRSARTLFERSLLLEPGRVDAQVGLGITAYEGDDFSAARQWIEAAQRGSPGALALDLWLARIHLALERPNAARERLDRVLSRSHSRRLRKAARALLDEIGARE